METQSDLSIDRKTFFIGLFLAIVIILVGYYALNRYLVNKEVKPASAQQRAETPQASFERSPFVQDAENDSEAQHAMSATGRPKVVMVHAPWCGHCRNMMGAFIQAASTLSYVDWIRADGNVAPSLVKRADLRGFPTVYGVSADGTVSQHNGARDVNSLIEFAKKIAQHNAPAPVPVQVHEETAEVLSKMPEPEEEEELDEE